VVVVVSIVIVLLYGDEWTQMTVEECKRRTVKPVGCKTKARIETGFNGPLV
jgi:hypothetical protein